VNRVADCNAARVSLAADMADDSQRIKVMHFQRQVSTCVLASDCDLMLYHYCAGAGDSG
jgi:hypothetical protein